MSTRYDQHFKQKSIKLALSSGQTYRRTANDLGIKYKTLCNWMQQTLSKPANQAMKSNKKPDYQELEGQNKPMKKELYLRKKQIEILKKAAQYFSNHKYQATSYLKSSLIYSSGNYFII